jgi:hypothetical protein
MLPNIEHITITITKSDCSMMADGDGAWCGQFLQLESNSNGNEQRDFNGQNIKFIIKACL